jgi:uncharacterized protein (DUF1697 family)
MMKHAKSTPHIALLRAVNVAGHGMVAMSDLRELVTKLGFADARSLLQSGNLIFRSAGKISEQVERLLEAEIEKRLGIRTDFFVRTAAELNEIIARNPFRKEAERDPAHLLALFLKTQPGPNQIAALEAAIAGPERFRVDGRLAYVVYPDGIGKSKVTTALLDRKLETRGTGRNWNTILKLAALVQE